MSEAERDKALSVLRRKRSTLKGTITKLSHKLQELENNPERINIVQAANLILEKAERDFRTLQEEIMVNVDGDEIENEQEILDRQDDVIENLMHHTPASIDGEQARKA